MRSIAPRRRREEEEESVFVSMADMTISFLIILMILLAFFASRFNDDAMVPRERFERVQAELEEARVEIDLLEEEVERLSLRADITPEDLALLREEILRLQLLVQQIPILEEQVARLEGELADLEAVILELRRRITELEEEIARLEQRDPLEEYLRQVANTRRFALERLRDAIQADFPDLQVVISAESDALRFQGEGLFASNARDLTDEKRRIVERIAELLDELLPCYSLGPRSDHDPSCNPGFAVVEAVQIEGHTDDVGSDLFNVELASDRAVSTYRAMTSYVGALLDHQNLDGEPVLSVAGYGENRPVVPNVSPETRATNRRIDLRFIMYSPSQSEEIAIIRRRLSDIDAETDE